MENKEYEELEETKIRARERKKYYQKRIRKEERLIVEIEQKQLELTRKNQPKLFEM